MSISLNSLAVPQPTGLLEELLQIQHDNVAIDGSMQRDRIGQKHQSTLTWDRLSPTDYQTLISLFTAGGTVEYTNDASNYGGTLDFIGLPTFKEMAYVRGSSLMRGINAVIREV